MKLRSFLGNLVLCCGLSTAVATTSEPAKFGPAPPVPLRTPSSEQVSSLPPHGVLRVSLQIEQELIDRLKAASSYKPVTIKFLLLSPPEVNAALRIVPDYPGKIFEAKIGDGPSIVAQPGQGKASAWDDEHGAIAQYFLYFAHLGRECAADAIAMGTCVPTVNLLDACRGTLPCTIGFNLERSDSDPSSASPTSVTVTAATDPIALASPSEMLLVSIDD